MYGPVPITGLPLSGGGAPGATKSATGIASFNGSAGSGFVRWIVIVPFASSVSMEREHVLGWRLHAAYPPMLPSAVCGEAPLGAMSSAGGDNARSSEYRKSDARTARPSE